MPHPHSLFLLADHHHHHDGTIEDDEHEDEHEHEHGDAVPRQEEFATRRPVVQAAPEEGAFGEQISQVIEAFGSAGWSGASEPLVWPLHVPLMGIGEPPEPPPPRVPITIV